MRRSWEGLIIRSILLSTEGLAAEGFSSKKRMFNHNCHLQIARSQTNLKEGSRIVC